MSSVFIIPYVSELTNNYHGGGGLVVVAENLENAKEIVSADSDIKVTQEEWDSARVIPTLNNEAHEYFVMENAGCC